MKFKVVIFCTFFVVSILYVRGCRTAGNWLIVEDREPHADAMVLLMGSITDRLLQAVDLYQSRVVTKLIIVEGPNDGYKELRSRGANIISGTGQVVNAAISLGIPSDSIIVIEGGAQSTQQEANIVNKYLMSNNKIHSLFLVTSLPHSRRAKMIFEHVFRKSENPVSIYYCLNHYTKFNADKWWKSKDEIETVLTEYLKLANFLLFERKELR